MMPTIVSKLSDNAEKNPSLPAVSDGTNSLTYADLWNRAKVFSAYLAHLGVTGGDKVLTEALPKVSYVIAEFAVYLLGAVFVPVERDIPEEKCRAVVTATHAVCFVGEQTLPNITCISHEDVLRLSERELSSSEEAIPPDANAVADILFTTGTTGTPKGVVLSHRAVLASADNSRFVDELTEESVYLIATPLNHTNALRKMLSCFITGAHAVLHDGFTDIPRYYATVDKYGVNTLLLPPSAVRLLLTVSRRRLSSLDPVVRVVHSGSAAMPEADKQALISCLPHARLIFGYGASEAGNACAYDYAAHPGLINCVGRVNPHTVIRTVDNARHEISSSHDNPGLIAISGETVMEGYLNDPEGTSEVLSGHTLYTNDVGYINGDGFVFILGRLGEIINCGGLKITPSEVENTVMQYPGIFDCACFGVSDVFSGTAVKLIIVPTCGSAFDMQAFRAYLTARLERYKLPQIIERVSSVPKTANGKTDRKHLR